MIILLQESCKRIVCLIFRQDSAILTQRLPDGRNLLFSFIPNCEESDATPNRASRSKAARQDARRQGYVGLVPSVHLIVIWVGTANAASFTVPPNL